MVSMFESTSIVTNIEFSRFVHRHCHRRVRRRRLVAVLVVVVVVAVVVTFLGSTIHVDNAIVDVRRNTYRYANPVLHC